MNNKEHFKSNIENQNTTSGENNIPRTDNSGGAYPVIVLNHLADQYFHPNEIMNDPRIPKQIYYGIPYQIYYGRPMNVPFPQIYVSVPVLFQEQYLPPQSSGNHQDDIVSPPKNLLQVVEMIQKNSAQDEKSPIDDKADIKCVKLQEKLNDCEECKSDKNQDQKQIWNLKKSSKTYIKILKEIGCQSMYKETEILNSKGRYVKAYSWQYGKCCRVFRRVWNLLDHLRMHFGFKPYQWSICNKKFTQKGNMIKHLRQHETKCLEERRVFKWDYCPKSYTERYNMKNHISKYHKSNLINQT